MNVVRVRDESRPGKRDSEFLLTDVPDGVTLRELIRTRVREEVALVNLKRLTRSPLVEPAPFEAELNATARHPRMVSWEAQAEVAEAAFLANGFFVIVDDVQVEDLDAELVLTADSTVRFLRLVALVGG